MREKPPIRALRRRVGPLAVLRTSAGDWEEISVPCSVTFGNLLHGSDVDVVHVSRVVCCMGRPSLPSQDFL